MISKADVVVVGSGGLGAATAYYLAKRGGLSVALLDKHDIGSQTSPRAAGMVSCVRKGDLMIKLIKDACRKIESFTEETGQPLDWVHSGSLKIARRPQDADIIATDLSSAFHTTKAALAAFCAGALIWGPWTSLSMAVFQDASPPSALAPLLAARGSLLIIAAPLGTALGGPLVAAPPEG